MSLIDKMFRMSRFERSSDIVRMKAVLVTTASLLFVMMVSFIVTLAMLKTWTVNASIVTVGMTSTAAVMLSFRYHDKFQFGAIGITLVVCLMISLAASLNKSGLNSVLLPFIPLTILSAGFISGWRSTLLSGLIAFATIVLLAYQSFYYSGASNVSGIFADAILFSTLLHLSLACIVAIFLSITLSLAMHNLFERDTKNVDKIQHVERQRTAFLSSLSHEIRTPLNGIVGMSKLLQKTELNSQQRQYAEIVSKCSDDLMEVMSTVMEFSQVNNQRIALHSGRFDLHKLAHDLVQKHASLSDNKPDVMFGMHIAPQVPQYFFADAKRLEMVINHLLQNALHFTPAGSVNLLLDGHHIGEDQFKLSVYVRDTGVGIRQEDLRSIYKPFHQLDNRLSREHEGTGLGLSLCKEIIEFMNGRLDVISEFGTGSTFFFELTMPLKDRRTSESRTQLSEELLNADDLENVAVFRKTA